MRRLGDPFFNRLGMRGLPWGFGPRVGVTFPPQDIDGLFLWLAADMGLSLNDGDPVATWPDQSGNGNDVTQGVGAARPTFRTGVLNGLPIVRFDGTDDILVGGPVSISGAGGGTVFLVLTASGGALAEAPFSHGVAGQNAGGLARAVWWTTGDISFRFNNGNRAFTLNPNLDQFYIATFWWADGADYNVHNAAVDGVDLIEGAVANGTPNITDNEVVLGASRDAGGPGYGSIFEGDIAEAILYNVELSSGNRSFIEAYLSDRYGISVS